MRCDEAFALRKDTSMAPVLSHEPTIAARWAGNTVTNPQAQALAERLEQGANQLIALASRLTSEQWQSRIPHDGRKVGVVVHHVASMYPIEIGAAQTIAAGKALPVTWDDVHAINAGHAKENDGTTKEA